MSRWFRLYGHEVLNDPKVQKLSPPLFKAWINMLCAASENEGVLPDISDLSFLLRKSEEATGNDVDALVSCGLLDEVEGVTRPHNWDRRQFKSDVSNERVERHRKRVRNVTEAVTETPPETETETETDITDANASVPDNDEKSDKSVDNAVIEFNSVAEFAGWAKVRSLTVPRKAKLRRLLGNIGSAGWTDVLARARASPFLCGENDRGWRADFDFLLRPATIAKVLEGSYDDKSSAGARRNAGNALLEGVARAAAKRLGECEREASLDERLFGDRGPDTPDSGGYLTIEGEAAARPG